MKVRCSPEVITYDSELFQGLLVILIIHFLSYSNGKDYTKDVCIWKVM